MTTEIELKPTFEEFLACSELNFEWAESYDSKDWERLARMLAPTLQINYANVNNMANSSLPAADFVTMMSNPTFLGDPLVESQHLLGAGRYRKISDTEIKARIQSRAAHLKWKDAEKKICVAKGHGHGMVEMRYVKVDGIWKWGGIATTVRWNEHDWDAVFEDLQGK